MKMSRLGLNGLRGSLRRWQSTTSHMSASEAGDTLIEVVIAVLVIALTAAALLGAITTSIVSSAAHRNLSTDDTLLRSYAEEVQYEVEQRPTPLYQTCAATYSVLPNFTVPTGYQLTVGQIQYWGDPTQLTQALIPGTATTALNVTALPAAMNAGDTLLIGNQTARVSWQGAPKGANTIPVYSFTPNAGASQVQWLYDDDYGTDANGNPSGFGPACSTTALTQKSALPGNDIQQLTVTVTSPTGIAENLSIVVRNYV
jgi:Tfp pilus assembly protein PilV